MPRSLSSARVVVIGGANTDITGRSEAAVVPRDSNPGTVTISPGGVARNIAENLARLGVKVTLITAFGSDAHGRELESSCRAARIDTTPSLVCGDLPGSVYLAILDEEGDMALGLSDMRPLDRLTVRVLQARKTMIESASLVIADTNLPAETLEWLAGATSAPLLVDLVSTTKAERAKGIMAKASLVKCNAQEAAAVLGVEEPEDAAGVQRLADGLVREGAKAAVVSANVRGAYYTDGVSAGWLPHPEVEVRNATGAGDAMSAGIGAGMLMASSLERSVMIGQLLAAATLASENTVSEKVSAHLLSLALKEWGT